MGIVIVNEEALSVEEKRNIETVRWIYREFLQGNIAAVLGAMDENVRVVGRALGVNQPAYARSFVGRDDMAAGFAEFMQAVSYQHPTAPVKITAKGDRVLAVGEEVREVRATGELSEFRWSMLWMLSKGKVCELRVLEDAVEALL